MPEPMGQQARWLEILEEYKYNIEHRPGKQHDNADAVSRRPCRQCAVGQEDMAIEQVRVRRGIEKGTAEEFFQPKQLEEDYGRDPQLATFYKIFESQVEPVPWETVVGLDKTTKGLWTQWDRITKVDGVLYREWISPDGTHQRWQLLPPTSIRKELMKMCHTGITGGHMGVRRTLHQLQL